MSTLTLNNQGSTPSTPTSGKVKVFTNANKALATVDESGFVLSMPTIRENETVAVKPATIVNALTASPTGITNTSGLMLGLNQTLTPQTTGRFLITICGVVAQSTTADGAFWHIRTGTGAAPSNAGALTGTQSGGQQSMTFLTGVLKVPFSITTLVTGLALGTAVWIDLVLAAITGGTATMTQVNVTVVEI